jgi:hypothetical protein
MDECVKYNQKCHRSEYWYFSPSLGEAIHPRKWRENVKYRREKGRNGILKEERGQIKQ